MALQKKKKKKKKKGKKQTILPIENITTIDYADHIALLTNTPTQAESLLQTKQCTCVLIKKEPSPL